MIINNIALLINNFIINLYEQGLHFYQIIIGMFIFNVILYIIRTICKNISLGRMI